MATLKPDNIALSWKIVATEEEVLQNQLNTITDYLAKTTLCNSPNTKPTMHVTPDISPFLCTPTKSSSVRHERIQHMLDRLSQIELTASTLSDEVKEKLCHSQTASFLSAKKFPLEDLLDRCRYLESDLTKIASKAAAVTGAKEVIQKQIEVIIKTLQTSKKDWKEAWETMQQPKSRDTIEYSNS